MLSSEISEMPGTPQQSRLIMWRNFAIRDWKHLITDLTDEYSPGVDSKSSDHRV